MYESIRVECWSVSLCGHYRHLRVLVAAHDLYIDTRQLCIFRGALRPAPSLSKFYYFVNLDKYDHPGGRLMRRRPEAVQTKGVYIRV